MRNLLFLLVFLFFTFSCNKKPISISSPDGTIVVKISVDSSKALYSVTKNKNVVLENSKLGIVRKDADFSKGLSLISFSETSSIIDNYTLKYGKKTNISYKANKRIITLGNSKNEKMEIIFQVSDDGIAFRYFFPDSSNDIKYISEEITGFNFPDSAKAWLQPCSEAKTGFAKTNPSYEENYMQEINVGTPAPGKAGWVFPVLFRSGDNYVVISESGLSPDYCGTRLQQNSPKGEYQIGFPEEQEYIFNKELNPQSKLPWYTPWRIIAIGSLKTIAESTLGTDVAEPAIAGDFSWVKPGISSWSWVLLKDGATVFPVQKQFIDYASDMGWKYCLIDALWDKQIGEKKIKELADYAKAKSVSLLLWYNSSGDWNETPMTPKNKMLTHESRTAEFKKLRELGIAGIKVDFFGGDGQSNIKYYHEILKDAAENGIEVNFHGCTLPRGWERTFPNLMSMEAIKGMEFITFWQGNADVAPEHCAMLPFTRNVFDPMDFTPVCFSEIPNIKRITSNGFELALSVLFVSGIQHIAETPEGMKSVPSYVKDFMKKANVVWDDSKFIDGYPGKYVVMARKKGDIWYVAGINADSTSRSIKMDLNFIKNRKGNLITDGDTNRSFIKKEVVLNDDGTFEIQVSPRGGFVAEF